MSYCCSGWEHVWIKGKRLSSNTKSCIMWRYNAVWSPHRSLAIFFDVSCGNLLHKLFIFFLGFSPYSVGLGNQRRGIKLADDMLQQHSGEWHRFPRPSLRKRPTSPVHSSRCDEFWQSLLRAGFRNSPKDTGTSNQTVMTA